MTTTHPQYNPPEHPHGEDDRLLTIEEVADILRTPVATLRYWRHLGIGPDSLRLGRRVVYWLSDIYRSLHEQSQGDGPSAA